MAFRIGPTNRRPQHGTYFSPFMEVRSALVVPLAQVELDFQIALKPAVVALATGEPVGNRLLRSVKKNAGAPDRVFTPQDLLSPKNLLAPADLLAPKDLLAPEDLIGIDHRDVAVGGVENDYRRCRRASGKGGIGERGIDIEIAGANGEDVVVRR